MRTRIINPLIPCLFLLVAAWNVPARAGWPWSSSPLVTIDGEEYSTEDFRHWWTNWKEDRQPLPATPDPYIDWILEYREAERMKLYETPQYRRKVLTFLKARALMMLKAEEIDSRITIDEKQIRTRYRKEYSPITRLLVLSLNDMDAARALAARLPEPVTADGLKEIATRQKGKIGLREKILRPVAMDKETKSALALLKPGQLSPPLARPHGAVLLYVLDIQSGDDQDYQLMRTKIRQDLWKEEEARLTAVLLRRLRKKYDVWVDMERVAALDISAPLDSFSDSEIIIRTKRGSVSAKHFMQQVQRQIAFRRNNGFPQAEPQSLKQQILNGIIDQTLTTWESLERGYEKKEPFRDDYLFYCRNNLIRQLEQRLFTTSGSIDDQEIKSYYSRHLKEFTRPAMIKMIIVEGSADGLRKLWTEVAAGGDFRELASRYTGHPVVVRELPADHLEKEVRDVVDGLTNGELSHVFTVKGHLSLIQLLEKKPARPQPLEQVSGRIRRLIREENRKKARRDFLNKLRENAVIDVNTAAWKELQLEMEDEYAEKSDPS